MESKKYTFFYKSASPFSQWHPATFVIDGKTFNCTEQYMMYGKAVLFKDKEIAKQILKTNDPRKQKALGRKVKNFDNRVWTANCKNIVYKANYAKFTQNEALKKALLATANTTLVEASPYDRIWGIGMSENHKDANNPSKWKGTNWLGEVLTQLREDIIADDTIVE